MTIAFEITLALDQRAINKQISAVAADMATAITSRYFVMITFICSA
jgi:hypothetical protein